MSPISKDISVSFTNDGSVVSLKAYGEGIHIELSVDVPNVSSEALYGAMSSLVEALEAINAQVTPRLTAGPSSTSN